MRLSIHSARWLSAAAALACVFFSERAVLGADEQEYQKHVAPLLKNYCFDCHADGAEKGEVAFDTYTNFLERVADRKLWLAVWQNLESQMMPPARKPQPSEAERLQIIKWIERDIFKLDPANPDPGRVTIRRLNREEYRNTILDLFGIEFDVNEAFPADDTGYGFDTIGDVLTMSPLLMEKYLDAAQEIVGKLMANGEPRVPTTYVGVDQFRDSSDSKRTVKNLSFDSNAVLTAVKSIKHPGPYRITVELGVQGSREATVHSATLILKVDGKEIERRGLGWDNRRNISITDQAVLAKGNRSLTIEIVPDRQPEEGENRLRAVVNTVSLHGPLDRSFLERPKEYFRLFMDGPPPADATARRAYAQKILRHYGTRAFRRPIDDATLGKLVAIAENTAREPGMTFEKGIGEALTAVLASPRFIFRAELQPEPNNPGKIVRVDEFALASRLSYFLWSSLPDDPLLALARDGKLRANLRSQVDRMLKDEKSRRFVRNFAGQWLQTRDVETLNIDARRILRLRRGEEPEKYFNGQVRRAMRQETEMLFGHLVKENRPVTELLTADYTFLNERLAEFYDISGVKGQEMRKVSLTADSHRRGFLTQGTYLIVTSNPTRTSPVKRGLFVLDNLLGTPAPPAPPNVPELEEARRATNQRLTMRQTMEIHREKAICASCHARMDPIGLAMENFNALGKFRSEEAGLPIDTAGQLITGEKFNNVQELVHILTTSRKKDFYRCATEKLLTYATGRGVEYYDAPTIERIVEQLERDGGRTRTLIYGVIESAPFQMRRGDGDRLLTDAAVGKN
jgi:mono/diheme cytochrome c family protein